jgi:hypothetical protein
LDRGFGQAVACPLAGSRVFTGERLQTTSGRSRPC